MTHEFIAEQAMHAYEYLQKRKEVEKNPFTFLLLVNLQEEANEIIQMIIATED